MLETKISIKKRMEFQAVIDRSIDQPTSVSDVRYS